MEMKRKVFYALAAFCLALPSFGQTFEWAKANGGDGEDVVRGMATDPQGNTYLTGYFTDTSSFGDGGAQTTITANGWFDVFVSKTDANGNLMWVKNFGGEGSDLGTAVSFDADGNTYVTGVFEGTVDVDPGPGTVNFTSAGEQDIFVVKLSAQGNFLWAKHMGGTGYEQTTGIGVDGLGNVYVTGYFYATASFNPTGIDVAEMSPAGMCDAFIVKYKGDGSFDWAQRFGGEDIDLPMAMKVKENGDLYITGQFRGMADFNPNPMEAFFLSTDPSHERGVFLLYVNESGYTQGAIVAAAGEGEGIGMDLALDANDNVYITGNCAGETLLNPGLENEFSIDGGQFTQGFVLKADFTNGVVWAKTLDTEAASFSYGVTVNPAGECFVSGYFEGTLQVGDYELAESSENADMNFLLRLSAGGTFTGAYKFAGANFIDYHGLGSDANGNIYVGGSFETTVDLNPLESGTDEAVSVGFRDVYTLKMHPGETSGTGAFTANSMVVYPNPAQDIVTLTANQDLAGHGYNLYDVAGRSILNGTLGIDNSINIKALPAGTYLLKVGESQAVKLIKQ